MTNLTSNTTNPTTNLTTIGNNMNNSTNAYESILSNGINESQERIIEGVIRSSLIKDQLASPKQAIITSLAFVECFNDLIHPNVNWVDNMVALHDTAILDNTSVDAYDVIDALVVINMIESIGGLYFITDRLIDVINLDTKAQAPVLASEGINKGNRLHNYGVKSNHISKLVIDAIHVLETTESTKSVIMEDIAYDVMHILKDNPKAKAAMTKFESQEYVLTGVNKLAEGINYVTEFKADRRFRLYQTACHGYNGQSSDFARSLQDLADVDMSYDVTNTLDILIEELEDMCSLKGDDLELAITKATDAPDMFIARALVLDDKSPIKKPWNFAKFSMLVSQLRNGERPYIGVAVGYDAKCSGPQLGALMAEEQKLLEATGFTTKGKDIEDAYHIAIKHCIDAGLPALTRSDIKKPFMAIFYGAGVDAMKDIKTIELGAFNKLYGSMTIDGILTADTQVQANETANLFHVAVTKAFGKNLAKLRKKIKSLSGMTVDGEFIPFLNNIIEHTMPCGAVISMNYKEEINMDGDLIGKDVKPTNLVSVSVGNTTKRLRNVKFKTNNYDLNSFARTGFVNMIQGTDALIARLIIVHARKLGIKNIISIHDCFRVDINNTALLQEAIKNAYMELFGSDKNEPTEYLPASLDIIAEYFKGANKATKEEFKSTYTGGMFFNTDKNQGRKLTKVQGKSIGYLINSLGNKHNDCFYFAK